MSPASVERWRLASVTIRQFRGVSKERTFVFDGRPGLLHGNNGVGKSTVAVAIQWILYGQFQSGVLPNSRLDAFLAPVQGKGKAYSGELALVRGDDRLVVARDGAAKTFTVTLGRQRWSDAEAERKRDEVLGLDMDTFVRAVLLQQSRIRGLLLDEPKERNRALDRLLGMDAAEHFLELIRPRDFAKAADAWRDTIRAEEQQLQAEEQLLARQLEEGQRRARDLRFLNKDLNATGLEARYAEISRNLVALARRYQVDVEPLPPCPRAGQVGAAARAFEKGIRQVRLGAEIRKRLTPIQKAIADLGTVAERATEAVALRDGGMKALDEFVKKHGDRAALQTERADTQKQARALHEQLKDANALCELLREAHDYVKRMRPRECPVCERALPDQPDLAARLRGRCDGAASADVVRVDQARGKCEARCQTLSDRLEELKGLEGEVEAARNNLERVREKAAEVLGGAVAENKLLARLEEALRARKEEEIKLEKAVEAMEDDLEAITKIEAALREGLLPVVEKRDEVARHEERMAAAKKRHARNEERAAEMDRYAIQLEAIRKAVISSKEELANELLGQAVPRAQALYRRLVRQPVFDTLEIEANARAAKVDYTFQVTAGGVARDARLVLSDGQLTATALALFFGLAESTQHALDLLYVDDPTQNLDLPCKEAMAKAIAEIAKRRQVVVSTQDEDFVTYLKAAGFQDGAVVHHLRAWDGNPTVETLMPTLA